MPQREHENNKSSIFEKLNVDERRAVDIALVERIPPTFAGVWLDHKLGEKGVSYSAFYRYARRLRDRANLAEIAELTVDDATELSDPIRRLLSRRVLDAKLTDDITPDEITRLMAALRQADRSVLQDRAIAEKSRIDSARLEIERDHIRLKSESLRNAELPRHRDTDQLPPARQRLLSPDFPISETTKASEPPLAPTARHVDRF